MNSIWVHSLVYALLPVLCIVVGLFFFTASILVNSQIGVALSTIVFTYGSVVLCMRLFK